MAFPCFDLDCMQYLTIRNKTNGTASKLPINICFKYLPKTVNLNLDCKAICLNFFQC